MSSDFLKINSYVMDDVSNLLARDKNNFSSTGDTCKNSFSVMKNGKLFNTGINKINNQFDDLVSRLNYMNNSISENTNAFFELERKLNEEALSIEIPTDFETIDSITGKDLKNVSLTKNDGRSVNDGKELFDNTEEFSSSINNQQSLGSITTSFESTTEGINEYTKNDTTLSNINNENDTNEISLREYKDTDNLSLRNIRNDNVTEISQINDGSIIEKKELNELEGDN